MSHRPRRASARHFAFACALDTLEPRTLCSFTLPTLGSLPIPNNIPSTVIPTITNGLPGISGPSLADQWWLKNTGQTVNGSKGTVNADVDAVDAWTITKGSSNVVIAVLDTGFDLSNSDLASALWTNPGEIAGDGIDNDGDGLVDDIHGWNYLNNSNDVTDNFVHGTAVASAIHSVAPGVTILPVEIGTAAGADDSAVINAINYLIKLKKSGVNIVAINASYISTSPTLVSQLPAIKAAGDAGMLYVAAAGNLGMNLDTLMPNTGSLSGLISKYAPSLAMPSNLIFVAATDNQDRLASFSDYGAKTVSVGAPGVDMKLAIPGGLYVSLSGTSFAAPMVSAIAGLAKSAVPGATMDKIKAAILNSGDAVAGLKGKTVTGRRVDAFSAIKYLGAKATVPTPTPTPDPTPTPTPAPTIPSIPSLPSIPSGSSLINSIINSITKLFHF